MVRRHLKYLSRRCTIWHALATPGQRNTPNVTDTTVPGSNYTVILLFIENLTLTNVTMTKDTEVDMKDVELNEMDQEKRPITGGAGNGEAGSPTGTEKNGSIKVKIPEEIETKFTGLSKEELLRVAGTPA